MTAKYVDKVKEERQKTWTFQQIKRNAFGKTIVTWNM